MNKQLVQLNKTNAVNPHLTSCIVDKNNSNYIIYFLQEKCSIVSMLSNACLKHTISLAE